MIVLIGVVGWVTGDPLTMDGLDEVTRLLRTMFPSPRTT